MLNSLLLNIKKKSQFSKALSLGSRIIRKQYRTEMKLVPIIMDYYRLQFDGLKFIFRGLFTRGVSS